MKRRMFASWRIVGWVGLITMMISSPLYAGLQKVNVGVYGGQLLSMTTRNNSGTNELMIGVDCNRGVFRWDATAACWNSVTWPEVVGKASAVDFNRRVGYEDHIYAIMSDTSNNTLLAASDAGGAATTWSVLGYGPFSTLEGHSSGMYIGMRNGVLARNQSGISGVPTTLQTFSREIQSLSVYDASNLFVALSYDAGQTNLFRVQDLGGGFFTNYPLTMPTLTASGSSDIRVNLIGVDPLDSNRLFCAGSHDANVQVYLSTNGGANWSESWDKDSAGSSWFPGGYPAYIRFNEDRTFISHSCLVKGGTNWTYQNNAITPIVQVGGVTNFVETHPNDGALAVDAVDDSKIYVATDWALAEYSCNASGIWGSGSEVGTNNGIAGVILNDMDFYSFSTNSKVLWIAAKSGLGRTVNFDPKNPVTTATPADWIFPLYPDGSPATTVEIHPTNPGIVLAGHNSGRMFKTSTGTNLVSTNIIWSQVFDAASYSNVFPYLPEFVTMSDVRFVPSQPSNVYASAFRWQPPITNGGVFYSADEGVTWSVDYSNQPVNALYVSDIAVWAGIGSEEASGRGLRVRMGPASWWNPGTGLAMDTQIVNDIDGAQAGVSVTVYCAANGGVYKGYLASTSMGGWASWVWTNLTAKVSYWNKNFSAVTVNPDNPDEVFLAAGNAILRSLNGGLTWIVLPGTGTIRHEDVRVLVYDDLLSGTANGLYSYLISDETTAPLDFDGDGISDIGCYDADNGGWYIYKSTDGFWSTAFGYADTEPVTGDFDGDGLCDYGVYHAPNGAWDVMCSSDGHLTTAFGFDPTVPVTGDFDGDGLCDYGCYYAPDGGWYICKSTQGVWTNHFGFAGTVPVTGDFDGDGTCDYGCYYAIDGGWYIYKSTEGFWQNKFGFAGAVPVTGDFDGDGLCDYGCYYAPDGGWYIYKSTEGFWENHFGFTGTLPVTGDYDGDGTCDYGCYYPPSGGWYLYSSSSGFTTNHFGYAGTVPLQ